MGFVGLIMAIALFSIFVLGTSYVISSLAVMRMLKTLRYKNAYFAWIPFARSYALADVVSEDFEIFGYIVPLEYFRFYFILPMFSSMLSAVPFLGPILSTLLVFLLFYINAFLYQRIYAMLDGVEPEDTLLIAWVSVFIPVVPVLIWLFKKYENPIYTIASDDFEDEEEEDNDEEDYDSEDESEKEGLVKEELPLEPAQSEEAVEEIHKDSEVDDVDEEDEDFE